MRRSFFILLLLTFECTVFAQGKKEIVIGKADSLYSSVLHETRKIWVYNPSNEIHDDKRYPVVYLLDGDSHFHSVTGIVHQLTSVNGNYLFPQMIVVGILNTDRTRDLTPTHSLTGPDGKRSASSNSSGGAENFTRFLETELFPYVETNYPTQPHRMLVGHSFGGLFAVNTLISHPTLFDAYVSIDPSIWWDHSEILERIKNVTRSPGLKKRSLFLAIANTMPAGMDTLAVVKDTTGSTSHIRSILKLAKFLDSTAVDLNFVWKYYDDDGHSSVALIAGYDAFRSLYDFFSLPIDLTVVTAFGLRSHYQQITERMNFMCLPPRPLVSALGGYHLDRKDFVKAREFFRMNVENYPKDPEANEDMGDYFAAIGQKNDARRWYLNAVGLNATSGARSKLEKLK